MLMLAGWQIWTMQHLHFQCYHAAIQLLMQMCPHGWQEAESKLTAAKQRLLPAGAAVAAAADKAIPSYFRGMNREECVAPMPGLPCLTGL